MPDSRRGRTPGALACRALASGSPRRSRAGAPHSQTIGARPTRACRFDSMHGRCLVRASVLLSALSAAIDVVRILFVCGALHARASGRLPPPGRLIRFGGLWLSRRRGMWSPGARSRVCSEVGMRQVASARCEAVASTAARTGAMKRVMSRSNTGRSASAITCRCGGCRRVSRRARRHPRDRLPRARTERAPPWAGLFRSGGEGSGSER